MIKVINIRIYIRFFINYVKLINRQQREDNSIQKTLCKNRREIHCMYVKKNSWVKHLDFILADLLCINLTLLIAYFLRNGVRNVYALKEYRTLLFAIMALHFCISFFSNTYSDILRRGYFQEFKRVLVHNTGLMLFIMVFMFFTHTGAIYSRLMIFAFWVMDIFAMYFVHICLKTFLRKRDYWEKKQTKLLIITTPENMEKVISEVNDGPDKSFEIVGIALNTNEEGIKECQEYR